MKNPYLFDLAKSKPTVTKPSGTVRGAYEKVFPIVKGQKAAMFLVDARARRHPRAALASRRLGVRLLHQRHGAHVGRRAEQSNGNCST